MTAVGSQLSTLSSQPRAQRGPVRRSSQSEGGFALLLTLTLLSFLVVLLVGLAIYTRVETAVAGNMQRQTQARENALLALNVAIGQLQKNAGVDQSVTATGQAFGGASAKNLTGVWDATGTGPTPRTWLVSGSENPAATPDDVLAAALDPAIPATTDQEFLVGSQTVSVSAERVKVTKQDITAVGVPGQPGSVRIGRYAWWVGDQGVKAPVAVPDTSDTVNYTPYGDGTAQNDLGRRIRQQIALGAGASDASGGPVFEPRDDNNSSLVANGKISTPNQLAFLKNAVNGTLGLTLLRQNFHTWSPNNYAVLANTKNGGLRQDLSLQPNLLGSAFAAWANYPAYMEKLVADPPVADGEGNVVTPPAPTAPVISPVYGDDPLRRRYKMTAPTAAGGAVFGVSPVLAECGLSFNIRTQKGSNGPLEVRARWYVSLWNPYTSALVPEKNMRLEIEGLPDPVNFDVVLTPTNGNPEVETRVHLRLYDLFQDATHPDWKFPINLGWDESKVSAQPDLQSWLPGRVYTWISTEHSLTPTPSGGLTGAFYETNFSTIAGQGDTRDTQSDSFQADDNNSIKVSSHVTFSGPVQLVAKLYRSADDSEPLAVFKAPEFSGVPQTDPQKPGAANYQFGFIFRLFESGHVDVGDKGAWLTDSAAADLRNPTLPATSFRLDPKKVDDPAQYQTSLDFNDSKFLLDRTQGSSGSQSYNEDVPLFELPRSPILSLGELQHLQIADARPFAIGNPWGANLEINGVRASEFFDRFYFSGLISGVTPGTTTTGDLVLPNPLLKPLRKPDQNKVTIDDVRALMNPPTTTDADGNVVPGVPASSYSSKFFLQGGAFNLNSVNANAWAAVLRGVRFPAPQAFSYLDAASDTGTAADSAQTTVPSSTDAQFFRFSQSAQETYKAEPGMADNDANATSPANTHLFRRGMRTLAAADVSALAAKIVELNGVKQATGPFRSLDEFLSPSALFAGLDADGNPLAPRSLLEAAIADAGINSSIAEFSSQWLTQADIMTALAPILFARSDTFVIRTYGEAVNPATNATEGRAWCEAIVQRVPDYVSDPANNPPEKPPGAFDVAIDPDNPGSGPTATDQLNKVYGRRFKVVSFRWLTRSDI